MYLSKFYVCCPATLHVCGGHSEKNVQKLVLSFHPLNTGVQTKVIGLVSKYHFTLSHLFIFIFFFETGLHYVTALAALELASFLDQAGLELTETDPS